ncbi:hypothetical protein RQP46_009503 [Phenoliferia psychrophenolica]
MSQRAHRPTNNDPFLAVYDEIRRQQIAPLAWIRWFFSVDRDGCEPIHTNRPNLYASSVGLNGASTPGQWSSLEQALAAIFDEGDARSEVLEGWLAGKVDAILEHQESHTESTYVSSEDHRFDLLSDDATDARFRRGRDSCDVAEALLSQAINDRVGAGEVHRETRGIIDLTDDDDDEVGAGEVHLRTMGIIDLPDDAFDLHSYTSLRETLPPVILMDLDPSDDILPLQLRNESDNLTQGVGEILDEVARQIGLSTADAG